GWPCRLVATPRTRTSSEQKAMRAGRAGAPVDLDMVRTPLGRMRAGLREELAVPNLVGVCIVFVPPRFFARVPRRLGELELPLAVLRLLLEHPEVVVVEDAQPFHEVRDGNPTVADDQQVFPVLDVRRRGKVVGPHVDTRR